MGEGPWDLKNIPEGYIDERFLQINPLETLIGYWRGKRDLVNCKFIGYVS